MQAKPLMTRRVECDSALTLVIDYYPKYKRQSLADMLRKPKLDGFQVRPSLQIDIASLNRFTRTYEALQRRIEREIWNGGDIEQFLQLRRSVSQAYAKTIRFLKSGRIDLLRPPVSRRDAQAIFKAVQVVHRDVFKKQSGGLRKDAGRRGRLIETRKRIRLAEGKIRAEIRGFKDANLDAEGIRDTSKVLGLGVHTLGRVIGSTRKGCTLDQALTRVLKVPERSRRRYRKK